MKGGLAKQRFQEWQRNNQIVGQLNQLKKQGVSDEEIRQAGPNAYQKLQQTTVKDGQTLDALAQQNGVTVDDLLKANPDMTSPKTGMVLNVPNIPNGSVYGSGPTIGGLPSNAALGATSNNPQGANMWAGTTPGYNSLQTNSPFQKTNTTIGAPAPYSISANKPTVGTANPFAAYEYKPPVQKTPYPLYAQNITTKQQTAATPLAQQQSPFNTAIAPQMAFRKKDDYIPTELAALINLSSTRYPTPQELAYLEKYGMITKNPQAQAPVPAYQNYGGRGGGGGGRGGYGGGGGGGVYKRPRRKAFSSGGGFNGLINWRI